MGNIYLRFGVAVLMVLTGLMIAACGGGGSSGAGEIATVKLAITDNDNGFESVVLTIEEIGIVASGTPTTYYGRDALDLLPVSVDVLDFPAEQVFHLADIEVPLPASGRVCFNQIRLVLAREGSASCTGPYCNYVQELDDPTPRLLTTPSGQQSGLKLLTPKQFCAEAGQTSVSLVLDFDPEVAIVHNDKQPDEYLLKPTGIRIIEGGWAAAPTDYISGRILLPTGALEGECLLYETMPVVTVEAEQVADPSAVVATTLALAEAPLPVADLCALQCAGDAGCQANCEAGLAADCYYSGPFKLLLAQAGDYTIHAAWDGLAGSIDGVASATEGVKVVLGD